MAQHTSGGSCQVWMRGIQIAEAVGASITQQNQLIRCDVLGKLVSTEILMDGSSCTFTCSKLYIDEQDFSAFGILVSPGVDGQITQTSIPVPVAVFIYNIKGDRVIARAQGLMLESISVQVNKGAAVATNISMQGTIAVFGGTSV